MKKLILLVAFGVWCLPLTAGWTPAQLRQAKPAVASGGACATTDTTLPHDTFLFGWESGDTGTWAAGGTGDGGTPNTAYDTSALTSGKPTGACNVGYQFIVSAGTTATEYQYADLGSIVIATTDSADLVFYLYVEDALDDGERIRIAFFGESSTSTSTFAVAIVLRNTSGTTLINASGLSDSTQTAISVGAWHQIKLHYDATGTACTLAVDGGTANTFTRANRGIRYMGFGVTDEKSTDDDCTLVFDLLAVEKL